MNLCNDGHDEVCFEGRTCPCCNTQKELRADIENLEIEITELKNEVEELKIQLS